MERETSFEADYGSGDVKEFTASNSYATSSNIATGVTDASGMAVDGAGNLFFSNYLGAKVYEAKLTGSTYATPVSIGTGFSSPSVQLWTRAAMYSSRIEGERSTRLLRPADIPRPLRSAAVLASATLMELLWM